jgi:hypothetical protein
MIRITMSSRSRTGAVLALVAIVAAGVASAPAEAKKPNKRVGDYEGTIEPVLNDAGTAEIPGGTVSFRITKKRRVVGFTAKNVPLYCHIAPNFSSGFHKGTVTFGFPTLSLQGAGRFFFLAGSDTTTTATHLTEVTAKLYPAAAPQPFPESPGGSKTSFQGKVGYLNTTGSTEQDGSEHCSTGEIEWTARKVSGGKK